MPLSKVLTSLEDKQKKLSRVQKALEKYEKEKEPLEEYLTATNVTVEECEPFGIDVDEGEKQLADLKVCYSD